VQEQLRKENHDAKLQEKISRVTVFTDLLTATAFKDTEIKKELDDSTVSTMDETASVDDLDWQDHSPDIGPDTDDYCRLYEIYKKGELLVIENTPEFWAHIAKLRKNHEANMERKTSKETVYKQLDKVARGEKKVVSKSQHQRLTKSLAKKDLPFSNEDLDGFVLLFDRFICMFDEIEKEGCDALRTEWTKHAENSFQIFCGCILSAGTLDKKLFDVMMAMRKLNLFDLKVLADEKDKTLQRRLEDLFLYVGFNYWTGGPANIIGAAKRIMVDFGGEIPTNKDELLSFYGIGRKIMMLVLQDAFVDHESKDCPEDIGLVVDRHLQKAFVKLGVTSETKADEIAIEMEAWLDPKHYRRVNEVFAGLRQLWESKGNASIKEKNRETIKRIANKHGLLDKVQLVCNK